MAEIIIGTYEDFVVGYRIEEVKSSKTGNVETCLEQSFAIRAHSGSIRTLATSHNGTLALSSGLDEMVNLYGLKRRKLLQTIELPITCAVFVHNSHLICGTEEGTIHIYEYKKQSLQRVKELKGHKQAITSLSIHPSGKVLLSLSKDGTMRTWNLIKGRIAYVTNIKSNANFVTWTKDGLGFIITADEEMCLYSISGTLKDRIKTSKRINLIEFLTDNIFALATDSKTLEFYDLAKFAILLKFDAHESRIKCVKFLDEKEGEIKFVTASSDGTIKVWCIDAEGDLNNPTEIASVDTGARIICMTTSVQNS